MKYIARKRFWSVLIGGALGVGACRAPLFNKKPDRVYVAPARNSATSPATLYNRLGAAKGIRAVVEDFVPRVMGDARVNFSRGRTMSPAEVAKLKEHLAQYISGLSGGSNVYEGRDVLSVHQGMGISDGEFDAFLEDLGLSMKKLGVEEREQGDLIQMLAGTGEMIVEKK